MTLRIPATVITGFLGAGKTTLIGNLLRNTKGKRIALIINEFGDLGIDGALLEELSACSDASCKKEDIVELANGCICCTVADDFIPTIETLLARKPAPDHIVIETSGLALPQPLLQAFMWPEVKSRVTVDGVITVLDTQAVAQGQFAANVAAVEQQRAADDNLDHKSSLHELFKDQLSCADLIVLNKTDLVTHHDIEVVTQLIERENSAQAQVVHAVEGKLPSELLIGLGSAAEHDLAARHTHHHHSHTPHDHNDFESFVVDVPPARQAQDIEQIVANVMAHHGVLRAKGFVAIEQKPMRLAVQAVGPRVQSYFDRRWQTGEVPQGRLVVIGMNGIDRNAITEELSGVLA